MSLFWYQPNKEEFPDSHECWTGDPNDCGTDIQTGKVELIGYVDLLYTTLERNK